MKKRTLLMNPGPVNVTERVRGALLRPDICHREPEFSTLLSGIRKKILTIFGIQKTHTVALLTGSGTAALESMLLSAALNKKKLLILSNGVYGERLRDILERHGLGFIFLEAPLGTFPKLSRIENVLAKNPSVHGIAMVHHETSSGMLNPLAEVASLAKKYNKTMLVDAISSIGAESIDFNKSKIDFLAGVSGKCLHAFPGVAWVLLSKEAASKVKEKKSPSLYLDLGNTLSWEDKNDTPFTPAVQLFYAFGEALKELQDEGLHRRIQNYAKKPTQIQQGLGKLGIRCLIENPRFQSHVLSAFRLPGGLSYKTLHDSLKKEGFVIYAGQSELKDKIFRIANLGDIRESDITRFLKIFAKILNTSRPVARS